MMQKRRVIAGVVLAWLIAGLFFYSQMYLLHPRTNQGFNAAGELAWQLALSFIWACSTPLIVWLSKRYRIEKQHWAPPVAVHLLAGVVIGLAQCMVHGILLYGAFHFGEPFSFSRLLPSFYYNIDKMLMVYWMIVFINHTYMYYQRFREQDVRAAQLESQLAQAQLQALKMQLHPHFLFNTLNAISSLMHTDVEAADRMMSRLSELLRLTLDGAGKQMVTLKEEIDFLNHYLEIEKIRFADRLSVRLTIAPETLGAQVPTLILQPLVENAIKHGIAPHAAAGWVEISAQRKSGTLLLQVKDNGSGFGSGGNRSTQKGLGISNTRSRLQKLYGTSFRFDISNGATEGTVVAVSFPFETEEQPRLTPHP